MRSLVIAGFVLMTACDPSFTFQGTVTDAADRPVANATVSLICYGAVQNSTRTDTRGRFKHDRIGAFGDSCVIEIRDGARRPLDFPIMEHCTHPYVRHTCTEATLDARLPWESGAP
jgi:hypothetical protein